MIEDLEELKDWQRGARREFEREVEHLRDKQQQLACYLQAFEATDELLSEIDNLKKELERREQEIESLSDDNERLQREVDNLRHQLIEQKEQQLDKEPPAPVMAEIHNHFESGCSAQVFNDKVKAKITKSQIRRWKKRKNQKA